MNRTYENCSLRKICINSGIGDCGTDINTGKCEGYASVGANGDGDEPCDICKGCKLNTNYESEKN